MSSALPELLLNRGVETLDSGEYFEACTPTALCVFVLCSALVLSDLCSFNQLQPLLSLL